MDVKEKLCVLEDVMDLEEGTLAENDVLASYDQWDSLAALSLMAILSSKFHKTITPGDVKSLKTVKEVLDLME